MRDESSALTQGRKDAKTQRTLVVLGLICVVLALCGCAVARTEAKVRVALLAPFEGRYAEIGYNALYAARLGVRESALRGVELLPIDDGSSVASAADRARALALDPQVLVIITLGYDAAAAETQQAADDTPMIIVGNWTTERATDNVFILTNSTLNNQLTAPIQVSVTDAPALPTPVVGGEVFALEGFRALRESLTGVAVVSSGALPDADFVTRYRAGEEFAPQPGLLATLVYDAARIASQAADMGTRTTAYARIDQSEFDGIDGAISFDSGWWREAPIHRYQYDDAGALVLVD